MIVYISIGNSDDKLSQNEWANFYGAVNNEVRRLEGWGATVHGVWISESNSFWQNACWCVDVGGLEAWTVDRAEKNLAEIATQYNQDSIAWAVVEETKFLKS